MTPMWIAYDVEGHTMKRLSPTLSLLAILPVFSTGCSGLVADFRMLESFAKSPNVSYDNADAWTCDVTKAPNAQGVVEDCGACVNVVPRPHVVSINGERSLVEPQG